MGDPVLTTMNIQQAKQKQFELTALIAGEFTGREFFQQGDVGVVPGPGRPLQTEKVERVLARFFRAEACALVRGAGTGAIRSALSVLLEPGDSSSPTRGRCTRPRRRRCGSWGSIRCPSITTIRTGCGTL